MKVLRVRRKWVVYAAMSCLLMVCFFAYQWKYISARTAMAEVNKYEVRSDMLMNAMNHVGVCSPEDVVKVWTNGLRTRSAALQYCVMSVDLKKSYAKQLNRSAPNWVTGISSPWVESYQVISAGLSDLNEHIIKLKISTCTSTGPSGDYYAVLNISREGGYWRIMNISMDEGLYPYTGFHGTSK